MADDKPTIYVIDGIPQISQANAKCCWFACYKMLYGWKGKSASSAEKKLKDAGFDTQDALYEEEWGKARDALELASQSVRHLKTVDGMMHVLETYGPIWCAGDFKPESGHAILLRGYHYHKEILAVYYYDPWDLWYGIDDTSMSHDDWREKVRDHRYACQLW